MIVTTYMSALSRSKYLGIDIGHRNRAILSEFAQRTVLSTYQIYSMYKRGKISGVPIAYKNALMHVKKLESLGFIVQVKQNDTKHGAIYYKISEVGMFQFFLRHSYYLPFGLPSILQNHGNDPIFKILLYPNVKKETLIAIAVTPATIKSIDYRLGGVRVLGFGGASFEITRLIFEYLIDCCKDMKGRFLSLESQGARPNPEAIRHGIHISTNYLVMKILLSLSQPKEKDEMNILSTLAKDEKFMNTALNLEKDFKRGLDFAMRLRIG